MLTSRAVDRGTRPRSDLTKGEYGICGFLAKDTSLRRKSKDWLARNQYNVPEWSDMSTHGLLFHWASTIKKKSN
jgi:predicted LPLAT superfamily acyltransferase